MTAVPWPVAANCSILALGVWWLVAGGGRRVGVGCVAVAPLLLVLAVAVGTAVSASGPTLKWERRARGSFLHEAMSFRPVLVSLSVWASRAKHSALDPTFDFGSFGIVCLASQ